MNQNQSLHPARRAPGLFFPIILIGIGVIWLLVNVGALTAYPWWILWRFWPVLLILAGLDILLSRSGGWGAAASAVLGLLVVGGVVALLFAVQANPNWVQNNPTFFSAPFLSGTGELQTKHLADPLDGASRAQVTIGFPGGDGTVSALGDSTNLLEGDVSYYGDLIHNASKNNNGARVELASQSEGSLPFLFGKRPQWNVRLNPGVTYDLQLNVGSGSCNFDLSRLNLSALSLNHGSGSTRIDLPNSGSYRFTLDMGSGSVDVRVPAGLPVRVEYSIGSGSLSVGNASRVSGDNRNGVYESPGYSQTGANVVIGVDLGSGSISIR